MNVPANGEDRTYDGSNNNIHHPDWGAAGTRLQRKATPPAYADGMRTLALRGAGNPSPRAISNAVCMGAGLSHTDLTNFMWAWGQFVDHELDLTEPTDDASASMITPPDDPVLPNAPIAFHRSHFAPYTGTSGANPREQINEISCYMDATNVYGFNVLRAQALRRQDGSGKLRTTPGATGELMPFNTFGLPNAMSGPAPAGSFFLAGDIRSNEHAVLTSMHTLFVREHNRLCDEFAQDPRALTGDGLYQLVRKYVAGLMQAITYNDFLPKLLGAAAPKLKSTYDPTVHPGIRNEFSTVGYRLGHSMLPPTIRVQGLPGGHLRLRDAFFDPGLVSGHGIEPFLGGLYQAPMQVIDVHIVEDVRSFLFQAPGPQGLLDLAALNIQRGRDHGIPGYNDCRQAYGLPKKRSFADINSDASVAASLATLYDSVDDIDPWVGALAENHVDDAQVGELIRAILVDQFTRLRDGDRFWYDKDPELAPHKQAIAKTTLSDILKRNTTLTDVPPDVFKL